MKYIYILVISVLVCITACNDTKNAIQISLPDNALVFKPAAGGAILHYSLPKDPDIVGIHVRYDDCYGNHILRTGSVFSDSLLLVGFNEEQNNVPANVTIQMKDGDESAPIPASFNTLESNPLAFINSVKVESGWNGFSLSYHAPKGARGTFHVFYLGTNPYSNVQDTILLESKPISEGGDTIIYQPKQLQEKNTIIVKAEDYRGYIVKEREWQVEEMQTAKHDGIKVFYNNSLEDDNEKVGLQYLTDGDTNGWRWFESKDDHKFYTFMSKKYAYGEGSEPMYVDIGEQTPTAAVRLYAYTFVGVGPGACFEGQPCWASTYCNFASTNIVGQQTNRSYYNRLPCDIDVYGCRESETSTDFAHMKWVKIGSFKDDPEKPSKEGLNSCWFYGCWDTREYYAPKDATAEDAKAYKPVYMSINFIASGQGLGYRYLKLVFNKSYFRKYEIANTTNTAMKVLTFNELEVYTKK